MDNKVIGGALSALGVLGMLLGLYIFEIASAPAHPKRFIAALILGVLFLVGGVFLAARPAKSAS